MNGVFCIRFVVGAERTGLEHVVRAAGILVEEAEVVIGDWKLKAMNEKLPLYREVRVKM